MPTKKQNVYTTTERSGAYGPAADMKKNEKNSKRVSSAFSTSEVAKRQEIERWARIAACGEAQNGDTNADNFRNLRDSLTKAE